MSTSPPSNPKKSSEKDFSNALIWAVLATAFAVGMCVYANKVDPEKKNFYLLAGGIGAVGAAFNAYTAWTTYNKSKVPK